MTDPVDTDALRDAGKRADYYQTGDGQLWRTAADEVDRLRAVIENAPHADDCDYLPGDEEYTLPEPCSCWKAGAL